MNHREKNFAVEVKPTTDSPEWKIPDECEISITHNGFQWYSWNLTLEERKKVIQALIDFDERKVVQR